MIRYALRCDRGHDFDGWFRSSGGFETMRDAGQVTCAECGSSQVDRALMAPAVTEKRAPLNSPRNKAEAALEALRRSRPDVVVLDVQLADRDDGWAIAELIDSVGPQPPRIVFSTGAPDRIPPQVAELGTVLEKPYDPRDLVRAVAAPRRRSLSSTTSSCSSVAVWMNSTQAARLIWRSP